MRTFGLQESGLVSAKEANGAGPLMGAADALGKQVAVVRGELGDLLRRLHPVLAPEGPASVEKVSGGPLDTTPRSPIEEKLLDIQGGLNEMLTVIRSAKDALRV